MHVFTLPFSRQRRTEESLTHPDREAIIARLPVIGARVPMREYWRQQPISPRRMLSHGATQARRSLSVTRGAARRGANGSFGRFWTGRLGIAIGTAAATATVMYYLDASSGRRRRARVRDRLAHLRRVVTRNVPERIERRGRFVGGVARGVRHNAAEILPHRHVLADDETLVARVRSEVLRNADIKAGEIHVDAYEGCVTLRGQLEDPAEIRKLVDRVRHVEGVSEVRSYLHLPGTPSPNKADAYNGAVPSHMSR